MGYERYHAIIVTGFDGKELREAHEIARNIFFKHFGADKYIARDGNTLVGPIIPALTNHTASFVVMPDGSKEGQETSDTGDVARLQLLVYLQANKSYFNFVEVAYGRGDGQACVSQCG